MKKRFVAILLIFCSVVSSGCGVGKKENPKTSQVSTEDSKETTTSKTADASESIPQDILPDEVVTLDVYSQLSNYSGEQTGWFAKEMLDKFHVKLNIINDREESYYDKQASNGDIGDIVIWGTDSDQYQSAIQQGLLLDWEKDGLLDNYGSYMKEHMQKALQKNKNNSNGHLYGFGYDVAAESGEIADFDYHPDIRWDLYEQIGKPEVNTLEDYVDVLKQMKEICPTSDSGEETYGVSLFNDWDGDMMMFAKSTCTNFFGVDEFGVGLYDVETGQFQGCLDEDGYYLRVLRFYNQLYQNGLVDPDSRTQGYEGCVEDYQDGRAFFCIFGWLGAPQYNTIGHTADGKAMLPLAAKDQKTLVYGLNENGGNRLWTIGSKCEYPELAMAIINWMCTPEGRLISEYGPKGICWDYDMDGNTCLLESGYQGKNGETFTLPKESGYEGNFADGCPQFNNTTWAVGTVNPDSNGLTYNYTYWPNVESKKVSKIEEQWQTENDANTAKDYLTQFAYAVSKPNTYSASTKSDELGSEWAKVTEYIRNGSWDAIFADSDAEFDAIVADMKKSAEKAGYADCVKWCEKEAKARKATEE